MPSISAVVKSINTVIQNVAKLEMTATKSFEKAALVSIQEFSGSGTSKASMPKDSVNTSQAAAERLKLKRLEGQVNQALPSALATDQAAWTDATAHVNDPPKAKAEGQPEGPEVELDSSEGSVRIQQLSGDGNWNLDGAGPQSAVNAFTAFKEGPNFSQQPQTVQDAVDGFLSEAAAEGVEPHFDRPWVN